MHIAIVDIETTGFLKAGGCIVEIGIAELNTRTGEIETRVDTLCREPQMGGRHRDAWIFENSSLTVEQVRAAPMLEDVREIVQYWLSVANGVTAYNSSFDFDFLRNRGFEINNVMPCPMRKLTPVCQLPKKSGGGFKWPSVEEAWKFLFPDHPYVELHRGADDAFHEACIYHECLERGIISESDLLISTPNKRKTYA